MQKQVDYSRILILRSGSNFDQPPIIGSIPPIPLHVGHGGIDLALRNLFLVCINIVQTIRSQWLDRFAQGVQPSNYIGDILGSLGGEPDFGPMKRS
jgi:purine nucleoside permease